MFIPQLRRKIPRKANSFFSSILILLKRQICLVFFFQRKIPKL